MRLVYIADPLCSWCYGFGPELARLLSRHPEARLDLVMGGLRAGHQEPATDPFRAMIREHWEHVHAASGLPFNDAALARDGFVYDTEPACRAVVACRETQPAHAYPLFAAIQAAFYRDGRDTTDPAVLVELAVMEGLDPIAFREAYESAGIRSRTLEDFRATHAMGVRGFPTLAVAHGQELFLVTAGYATADVLEHRLAEIESRR